LRNKSQLNEQLQADYDEALQRLAQAELTIDQLRFGVQTEVSKIVYYTLKETDRQRASREGSRDPNSRPPAFVATTETANQTTTIEREQSSEDDVTSMSMNTRGQRANMEGKQMALLFQTRSLQDRLDQIQEDLQSRGPVNSEIMETLAKIGNDVRKIEEEMTNVRENQDKLFETRGVQSEANFDDLNEELGHLKQMLAETQQHLEQQKDETPESFRQDTPHMERHQPTLQDVMDRLANLEEQQRVDPTPGTAAEIRQLRQVLCMCVCMYACKHSFSHSFSHSFRI
jgi:predicted RNA-binding Zn ribbon-like protein